MQSAPLSEDLAMSSGVSTTTEDIATVFATAEPPVTLSLSEVRRRITVAAQAGYAAQVKALLNQYGATKLSDVDSAQYQTLLADLEDLMKSEVSTNG